MKFEDWFTKMDFGGDMWADFRRAHEIVMSLESQLQHSKEWFSEAEERINLLETQLKERDEALIDLYDRAFEAYHHEQTKEEWERCEKQLTKHQSLINQIKESRK